jgi:hypothetical protein
MMSDLVGYAAADAWEKIALIRYSLTHDITSLFSL